jgi:hypothetical protein
MLDLTHGIAQPGITKQIQHESDANVKLEQVEWNKRIK